MTNSPLIAYPKGTPPPDLVGVPIAELKKHLVLFLPTPPGPNTAARIVTTYFDLFADRFVEFGSTATGSVRYAWNSFSRRRFMTAELPRLRRGRNWGYSFSDGRGRGSWMMMFHGFRPVSEAGQASILRFEFDWELPAAKLRNLAERLLQIATCTCGTGGFVFQGFPRGPLGRESWNKLFAWARRYWGVEVQDLDATTHHAAAGVVNLNWLTIVGPELARQAPEALGKAKDAATSQTTTTGGILLQVGDAPILGDRNRGQDVSQFNSIATILDPIRVKDHRSFAEGYQSQWDEDVTRAWLGRFASPEAFAAI